MKRVWLFLTSALLLGGLVAWQSPGVNESAASVDDSQAATETLDESARILAAIEEASRFADFSKGEVIVKVRTTLDSSSTIIEVRPDYVKSDEFTLRFLALVNADGSLTQFNHPADRKEATTSEAFVNALEFWLDIIETAIRNADPPGPDANPHFWITEFTARIENNADHTDVFLDIRPGSLGSFHALRVKGDEVTIKSRWRPNPSNGPDTTGAQ